MTVYNALAKVVVLCGKEFIVRSENESKKLTLFNKEKNTISDIYADHASVLTTSFYAEQGEGASHFCVIQGNYDRGSVTTNTLQLFKIENNGRVKIQCGGERFSVSENKGKTVNVYNYDAQKNITLTRV